MELNLMIIAGMILATLFMGCAIGYSETKEDKKQRKTTEEIWGYRL